MVLVLQEAEASVLLFVVRLEVQNDITEALWRQRRDEVRATASINTSCVKALNMVFTSNFGELFDNLLLRFTLGDGANKQTVVGDGYTNTDLLTGANLMIITLERRENVETI